MAPGGVEAYMTFESASSRNAKRTDNLSRMNILDVQKFKNLYKNSLYMTNFDRSVSLDEVKSRTSNCISEACQCLSSLNLSIYASAMNIIKYGTTKSELRTRTTYLDQNVPSSDMDTVSRTETTMVISTSHKRKY